ncbi:putative Zn(II)2Cys6 transcription factor-like protein [Byssothecium circinans]|uniref:Putative Zn(II)2Cys6 transcription factor-like protein n=1 Tax=Byssothecium circinans TaxID=147558 RepID=A0A6A5ULB6_9PLEO|nr:putative Zn(II)2Cys6 transcription factor-like protein [Byssothecium circinans]
MGDDALSLSSSPTSTTTTTITTTTSTRPRQRKFAPRSRQGCLTCRARRKRCDGQRPECQNCTRLNLSCEWQAQRRLVVPPTTQDGDNDVPTPSPVAETAIVGSPGNSLNPWDMFPGDAIAERNHLLRYYVDAFVPSVSVADTPHSFYTRLYIPWAFSSDGVLNAIIALSAAQLARRTTTTERAQHLRSVSAKHQRKCYAYLSDRIPISKPGTGERVPPRDAHQVIGIILLLVGLEALNGEKSTRWLSQMKCVRDILNVLASQDGFTESWELDSLRRHFTYHNAMASLMSRISTPPNTASESLLDSDLSLSASSSSCGGSISSSNSLTVDPLMGIAYYMCRLISRIQYVTSANDNDNDNATFPHITEAAFASIELDIQNWTYPTPMGFPGLDLPIALDLIALAEAYRLAALIQLYRTSLLHKPLVAICASRAMEFMSRIPPGSPAESSMLYPIFLAGAELDNEPEIAKCAKRLREIQARNCYENVGIVIKVLEEVWRPGEARRDWEDVVREWGWSFTLG